MIEQIVSGNPYEVGFQIGEMLKSRHAFSAHLLDLQEERIAYTKACLPIYEQYYPEVLQELQGISDALSLDVGLLQAFTLGMYAYSVDTHCSCIALSQEERIYLGRNSDFLKVIKDVCLHIKYVQAGNYSFIGNTTSFTQMEDGMNEHGFAIGLTFVEPMVIKPGLNAGMLVRYLLERCKSVEEAYACLKEIPIGSSQTLTMVDASGKLMVVECNSEKIAILEDSKFVYAVNNFYSESMKAYHQLPKIGDLCCEERHMTLEKVKQKEAHYDVSFVQNVLKGTYGFLCQYDPSWPGDTVWSTIYDVVHKTIYVCAGNPSRETYHQELF